MKTLRIGTRGSQLALWQANEVQTRLRTTGTESEIVVIRTTGDARHDVSLATIGGKGLFIKEIEEALDRGDVDLAVHSLKDVPSLIDDRFELAAFLDRADPRDVWVHPEKKTLDEMPSGAKIGTSAPRRRAQLAQLYPSFEILDIRGNVDTRIAKAARGDFDGIVLASAGITRLGRVSDITSYFSTSEMIPASGQGIVGIEILASRDDVRDAVLRIDHAPSARAARTERGVLQRFGTRLDCYSAIAVHATGDDERLRIDAFLSDYEGKRPLRVHREGVVADQERFVGEIHEELVRGGALELLQSQHS